MEKGGYSVLFIVKIHPPLWKRLVKKEKKKKCSKIYAGNVVHTFFIPPSHFITHTIITEGRPVRVSQLHPMFVCRCEMSILRTQGKLRRKCNTDSLRYAVLNKVT